MLIETNTFFNKNKLIFKIISIPIEYLVVWQNSIFFKISTYRAYITWNRCFSFLYSYYKNKYLIGS